MKNKEFFLAVSVLIGAIVGAGIFGIPHAFVKSGIWLSSIYLIILSIFAVLLHLFVGETVCRTEENSRFVGYAYKYLGIKGKFIATFADIFGIFGSLLVYMILAGDFMKIIFSNVFNLSAGSYSFIFFTVCSVFIFFGLKLIAKGEFVMTVLLLAVIAGIFIFSFPYVNIENIFNIKGVEPFLAYGVLLYALTGSSAVPEMKDILKKNGRYEKYNWAIILGTLVPAIIYAIFAFVVVGVTGASTTEEAINGLEGIVGDNLIFFGALFGILAVTTSFLVFGLYLKDVFTYDYKINKFLSWLIVCGVPLTVFLSGFQDFVKIISIIGSFSMGLSGIIIVLVFIKAKKNGNRDPEFSLSLPFFVPVGMIAIFFLGILYQVAEIFF